MKNKCIFCKIATGELPSTKIHEDNNTLTFMDICPVVKGHALIIPKHHYDPITATPDDVLQKLIVIAKKIAKAQIAGLNADGINITQANGKTAGQIISHIHFHVIPRFKNDKNSWNWIPKKYDNNNEIEEYAKKIRNALT